MKEAASKFPQAILTNVASLLGAEASRASRDMREVILFEIELAGVSGFLRSCPGWVGLI